MVMCLRENAEITIFIPVYNGENFIERAIKSVLDQTFCKFILVVSDNCSTDKTRDIVKQYFIDDRVHLVARQENVGMIENFNGCLENISTKYYMTLSHDDYLCRNNALQIAYEVLQSNEDIPVAYCETMLVDTDGRVVMKRSFGFSGRVENDEIAKKALIAGRNIFGVPLLIRADAVGATRYSTDFANTADIDFSMALGKGRKIYFVPKPLIAIRFHASNETHRTFSSLKAELLEIAKKHRVRLSSCDHILMNVNDVLVRLKKQLFFYYLDKVRR